MIEGAIECVRRGFQVFMAIWPLLLVRLIETIAILIIMAGGLVLAMIPIGLSLDFDDFGSWVDDPEGVAEWFLENIGTVFYLLMVILVLGGVAVLVHSYFEAGVVSLYLDHIRRGVSFHWSDGWARFSFDAFTQAAISRGWAVFVVYNIVWSVACAILLIPLGLILAVLLIFRDSPAAIVFTCVLLAVVVVVGIFVSIVATVWAQIAVTLTAGERRGPVESSGLAGDLMRARLGVTVLTVIIVYAVIIGFSSVTSTFNFGFGVLAEVEGAALLAMGLQVAMFFVNSVVSTVLGLWTAAVWAAFVATSSAPVTRPVQSSSGGIVGSGNALVG